MSYRSQVFSSSGRRSIAAIRDRVNQNILHAAICRFFYQGNQMALVAMDAAIGKQAGTDAGAWRSRGIPVYGIYPYAITAEDLTRMHGNDERVSVESLAQGTELVYKTLLQVAAKEGLWSRHAVRRGSRAAHERTVPAGRSGRCGLRSG